jgi:hypothetical protein
VYSTYSTLSILASTINTNINTSINNFVLSEMKYIIPASAQNRQRSTDPLRFSIRWKSALTPNYLALEDSWGLGWNLGYAKADTPFATVQIAESGVCVSGVRCVVCVCACGRHCDNAQR